MSTMREKCLCGCGGYPKSERSIYCQGHDAKHIAKLLTKAGGTDAATAKAATEALVLLFPTKFPDADSVKRALSSRRNMRNVDIAAIRKITG